MKGFNNLSQRTGKHEIVPISRFLRVCSRLSLLAATVALLSATLQAAPPFVYSNLNLTSPNAVGGFELGPPNTLTPIFGTPWSTSPTSSSAVYFDALKDQALYANTDAPHLPPCLYVGELSSGSYPNGDIAAFTINTGTGALTYVASYPTPAGITPPFNGIALSPGHKLPALFAGYSAPFPGTNYVTVWRINQNTCALTFQQQAVASPLNGGAIDGMAESQDDTTLVAAYADGSIESFPTVPGFTISPGCPVNSTGFVSQGSWPSGVDVTADSKYAIFGDQPAGGSGPNITEVEMVKLPIACSSTTTDWGGPLHSNVGPCYLGTAINSTNVWLGPEEHNLFVSNNGSEQVTTIKFNESLYPAAATMTLAGAPPNPPCLSVFTNPTTLRPPVPGIPFYPNGMQTSITLAPNPLRVYVGEFDVIPASDAVGLLRVQLGTGCTNEPTGSPYFDFGNVLGSQLSAWPPRPF